MVRAGKNGWDYPFCAFLQVVPSLSWQMSSSLPAEVKTDLNLG
eukprot:COSAG01_NODE_47450_length_390_cov_0.711340_1_plen_42_part_10